MVGHRRRDLIASRRRAQDEGEEETGSETAPLEDDSLSEASALSDLDDEDADADGSDISEQDEADAKTPQSSKTKATELNGHAKGMNGVAGAVEAQSHVKDKIATLGGTDTETMMNGLRISNGDGDVEEINFEDMGKTPAAQEAPPTRKSIDAQPGMARSDHARGRRSQEQEEYKKKRDADPTFVPNRGGFFMHDHRHAGPAANGFRPFGRGRAQPRGGFEGQFPPAMWLPHNSGHNTVPSDQQWSHDLHEAVVDKKLSPTQSAAPPNVSGQNNGSRALPLPSKPAPPNRSFSRSVHIGNVQIRVLLPGMEDPITFSAVPVKQYTRLPHHRPPLRRDKPVRISLPSAPPRYIFPSNERSFIFIPRAQRPNQQGYGRPGSRGGFGPYRGFSSRRTSVYRGSVYSPSVTMSRRSSLAHEVTRDSIVSRSASTVSRQQGAYAEPDRPVVRLPPVAPRPEPLPSIAVVDQACGISPNPLHQSQIQPRHQPYQKLAYNENMSAQLPMHQPRPQKTVSVAGIESPEKMTFHPPPQQQQPFHQQVPPEVNGTPYMSDPHYNLHVRNTSYPSHPSIGTPLSQIPEGAIHAQPFQPHSMPAHHPPMYGQPYAGAPPQGPAFYAPSDLRPAPFAGAIPTSAAPAPIAPAPIFVPGQPQNTYLVPMSPAASVPSHVPGQETVAQESNGMVYYYDVSQLYGPGGYPAVGYPMAQPGGAVGMAGMMTPSPDGFYYPQTGQGVPFYN